MRRKTKVLFMALSMCCMLLINSSYVMAANPDNNFSKMEEKVDGKIYNEKGDVLNLSYIELTVDNTSKASYILADKMKINNFKITGNNTIRVYENKVSPQDISRTLSMNDVSIEALGRKSESLEDFFLKLTEEGK